MTPREDEVIMMPKRYSKQAQSGEAGAVLIDQIVTSMGFLWHGRRRDYGIDGEIEVVDLRERRPCNRVVFVQSKARERFPGESDDGFHYICEPDDVEYWLEANVPVILICSHPATGEAWWAPVSQLLRQPSVRLTRRIDFDKVRDRLDIESRAALVDLVVPPSGGLYVESSSRPERLVSNLLRVEAMPPTIWMAPSIVADNGEAGRLLRREGIYSRDWTIRDRMVVSFRRPHDAFPNITDGAPEAFDTSEWAGSKVSDTVNLLVRLLTQTLLDTHHRELWRHPEQHYLYFRATPALDQRKVSTGKSNRGRVVFRAYPDQADPASAKYFRHHAAHANFVRLDGRWFYEISPTYHYTSDGLRDLPWGPELVKGMKRREKNPAVADLVEMWANYLKHEDHLFAPDTSESLRFGDLEEFDVDRGVDEETWQRSRKTPAPTSTESGQHEFFEAP